MTSYQTFLSPVVLRFLSFGFLIVVINIVVADERGYIPELNLKAKELRLWQDREWLNLLHYVGKGDVAIEYKSEVRDSRFFLAPDGKTNPESELLATIAAFYKTDVADNDNAQCKFIARFEWLKRKLSIATETLPAVNCDEYLEWRKHVRSDRVTLVFPAYHLNSPSSMFGHTLLRLDGAEDEGNTRWLSTAVNFGAKVTEADNSILYAYKGLAGGYSGVFVVDHYYKKIQEYNRIEHRDIWEYRLNLTPAETERIVTHLWELQDIEFDYYYFDENCSYRLLELLEVARPGIELTKEFKITAIPVDTVRAVADANMIVSETYRPSQVTLLMHYLEQVPEGDRELIISLSQDIAVSRQEAFTRLPEQRQKDIVDLAYQYLSYQQSSKKRDPVSAKRRHQLLLMLNSYPKDMTEKAAIEAPAAPEKGHGSKRVMFGVGRRLHKNYLELGFKMSFHDLEDNEKGFLRGAQINIGTVQVRAQDDDSVSLYQLDLVDIFSLTPRTRFFTPLAWKVYAGLERQMTKGIDQLTGHVTGGAGGSWLLSQNSQFYALAIGRLEVNKQLQRAIEPAIGFTTGLLQHFGSTTAHLEVSGERFLDNVYRLRTSYMQNFVIRTNHSVRLLANYQWQEVDEFSELQLNYQYYF
ncbi:Lnb N-terminal periplasmic domain-containing protein [Kaarinaea lacus]